MRSRRATWSSFPKVSVHFYQNLGEEPFEFLCIIPNKEDKITIVDEASC